MVRINIYKLFIYYKERETYVVLAEEAEISQNTDVDQKSPGAEEDARQGEQGVVEVLEFDGDLTHGPDDDEDIVDDNHHVPRGN